MKIWNAYGSEHSANLMMIGCFKCAEDAKKIAKLMEDLTRGLDGKIDVGTPQSRYSDEVSKLLNHFDCFLLTPQELEQFLIIGMHEVKLDGNKIIVRTDEDDVSAFMKLMLHHGAKIEIFSRHFFTDSELHLDD